MRRACRQLQPADDEDGDPVGNMGGGAVYFDDPQLARTSDQQLEAQSEVARFQGLKKDLKALVQVRWQQIAPNVPPITS